MCTFILFARQRTLLFLFFFRWKCLVTFACFQGNIKISIFQSFTCFLGFLRPMGNLPPYYGGRWFRSNRVNMKCKVRTLTFSCDRDLEPPRLKYGFFILTSFTKFLQGLDVMDRHETHAWNLWTPFVTLNLNRHGWNICLNEVSIWPKFHEILFRCLEVMERTQNT